MSRRPTGAADTESRANSNLLCPQRTAPAASAGSDIPTHPDPSIDVCQDWLACEQEFETLTNRWQTLERYLIRTRKWFELSELHRALIPEARELRTLDERIDALQAKRLELLANLPALTAATPQGLSLKLAVAAAVVRPDENKDAHCLIASILRDLQGMICQRQEASTD